MCEILNYINCQTLSICNICVKGLKCNFYKEGKNYSRKCTKQYIYNACFLQKKISKRVTKQYYV